jgi:hypothetical protein
MPKGMVMATEMAVAVGIDPKAFRQALREANFPWHREHDFWIVPLNSPQHEDMQAVLAMMLPAQLNESGPPRGGAGL